MTKLEKAIYTISKGPISILEIPVNNRSYIPLDLSTTNNELAEFDITDYNSCQSYIDMVLNREQGQVAYGGYLERRNLYSNHKTFTKTGIPFRNIHLGIDFWSAAGTKVITPLDGIVHSFQNNSGSGDYGPTIILEHHIEGQKCYSLYGHLTLDSLDRIAIGKVFKQGTVLGFLGTPDINVGYAPHLHFQIISDLEGNNGDYPGVCAAERLEYFKKNCPDPNLLLKILE